MREKVDYAQKGQLDRHDKVVHRNIKDFKCNQCDREFGIKQDVQIHLEKDHEPLTCYMCNLCQKDFEHRKLIQTHLNRIQRESNNGNIFKKVLK